MASFLKPYNLRVTNVRGPSVPIYLLGAPLTAFDPTLPLFENQGLAVAVLTYGSKLHVGLSGDWDLLPDLGDFAEDLWSTSESRRTTSRCAGCRSRCSLSRCSSSGSTQP